MKRKLGDSPEWKYRRAIEEWEKVRGNRQMRADLNGPGPPWRVFYLDQHGHKNFRPEQEEFGVSTNGSSSSSASADYFDRSGLLVAELGAALRREAHIRVGHDKRLYRYDGGVYRGDGDDWSRARVREILDERYRKRHVDEVLSWLRAYLPEIGEQPPLDVLNVANGLLDWRRKELRPHTPEVFSTIQLPVTWDPDARCPLTERFLREVVGESADLVLDLVAYALYPGNPFRQAALFLGVGRNGKSVALNVIRTLLGSANVSAVPLQTLAENRFAGAELYGKLANIAGDLDARAIRKTDTFKMLTGNDLIRAERKFGQAFYFTSFALPLFSANEAPISSDQSDAWFDRWVVVPFPRRFTEQEADAHLTAKLTTRAETSGLLRLAVERLPALLARGRFDLPSEVRRAGEAYRDRLDTVRGFVAEECVLRPGAWVVGSQLYRAYRRWCGEGGRLSLSATTFNEHLERNYVPEIERKTRRGKRGYVGVGLQIEEHDDTR